MAVPWQTDTSSCLSRYKRDVDGYLPAFWPARVPNDVLDLESYETVMDDSLSLDERQAAFENRVKWLRDLPGFGDSSRIRINAFLRQWADAGVVTSHPGPDDPAFPETFWVELGTPSLRRPLDRPADRSPGHPNGRRPGRRDRIPSRHPRALMRTGTATVAILGGGPAGASAALELARLGIDTLLIEQTDGSGNPVGECLAPSANPLLRQLGLMRSPAGIRRPPKLRQPLRLGRRRLSGGARLPA